MKKVLAILAINPDYIQFAIPQLKSLLSKLPIPLPTLFSQSTPLPPCPHQITHKNIKNFPYVTLTVPDFQKHRQYFQNASKKAVMVSKFVLVVAQGGSYEDLANGWRDQEVLNQECRDWNQHVFCEFVSRNRVISRQEQVKKIHHIFQKFDIRGKVDLKNPTKKLQLIQQHTWYQNHHEVPSTQTLQKVFFGIELSSCKQNKAKFNIKYQLSNRIYLGPTSTDNDLAFLMCNQANIEEGSYVFDPFVGTAGLLIPPASHGAIVFGCDLDMRVLNGYAVGRINKKSEYYGVEKKLETFTPKINLNFQQYGLPLPNIIRMDCTKCTFAPHMQFDAIISDPPYGLRAMSRSMKKKENKVEKGQVEKQEKIEVTGIKVEQVKQQQDPPSPPSSPVTPTIETTLPQSQKTQPQPHPQKEQLTAEQVLAQAKKTQKKTQKKQSRQLRNLQMTEQQKQFKQQITQKLNRERIDNWDKFDKAVIENTQRQVIFEGLLNVARRHLKVGGRLVFLYPIYQEEEFVGVESLPQHDGFGVVDMSQNILSRNNSRILVTLEKL